MKLTKSDLKEIVKQCLVEIFEESFQPAKKNTNVPMGKLSEVAIKKNRQQPVIDNKIKTGNPVMDSIFADTAANTLPAQIQAESARQPVAVGKAEQIVAASSPEDLFGDDASSKWASLAFGDFSK